MDGPAPAGVKAQPMTERPMRVLAMVNNPCIRDARVIRGAEAMAAAGHEVRVLCHWAADAPENESVNGVDYFRLPVRAADKVKRRRALAEAVSASKESVAVAARSPLSDSAGANSSAGAERSQLERYSKQWFASVAVNLPAILLGRARRFARKAFVLTRNNARKYAKLLYQRSAAVIITGGGLEILRHNMAYTPLGKKWQPDVVHAHDLYTLLAGYRIARATGAALVYDSHELEVGRNGNYSGWERRLRAGAERFLIKRCRAVITVCDSIAEFLQQRYEIERPIVVHNAPSIGKLDRRAADIKDHLQLPKGAFLALYVGSVTIHRGLEQSVEALPHIPGCHLACVGPAAPPVVDRLAALAERLGVSDRVHFVPPVPHDEVTSFIRSADLSLILIQDVCLSYHFCFPNKLLESLLAGIPVVASRLPELERIVSETGAGVLTDQADPQAIARAIGQVMADHDHFVPSRETRDDIERRFALPVQNAKLLALYQSIGAEREPN